MNMTLGGCDCCTCSPCSDSKFWNKKKWTITGVEAQGATIYTSPTPGDPPVFTTTIDLSPINGEHEMDAIARVENGDVTYISGYDAETLGDVIDEALLPPDFDLTCGTVYEVTIEGVASDIYQGSTSYAQWSDPDKHLTDCDIRVRLYEFKQSPTTVSYAVFCCETDPLFAFAQKLLAIYEDVDIADSCDCDTTVLDVSTLPEYDQEACQFILGVFYSLTDTWTDVSDVMTVATFGLIDPPPAVLSGTANWTFEGAGTRVETL